MNGSDDRPTRPAPKRPAQERETDPEIVPPKSGVRVRREPLEVIEIPARRRDPRAD
jgi:hypothetical protein